MTMEKRKMASGTGGVPVLRAGQACFAFLGIFCILLLLRNTELAIEYVRRGLSLSARTVIPSLFPFMVLAELTVTAPRACRAPLRVLSLPLCKLLGITGAGGCALLLGWVCGFPIGARCALSAFSRGEIGRRECELILSIAGCPSSAFLIGAVGVSLMNDRRFGLALYAALLLAALTVGVLFRAAGFLKGDAATAIRSDVHEKTLSPARLFTRAVRASTESILLVCAYVVFFSALTGVLDRVIASLSLPPLLSAALGAFFEISGGVSRAAALPAPFAAPLVAAACAWSGLSVHCQLLSLTDAAPVPLSFSPYLLAKLLQSLLAPLFLCLFW